jgi:hypothetical protein
MAGSMSIESVEIIDVEAVSEIPSRTESIQEEGDWLKPAEAQYRAMLDKSGFQRAMAELIGKYACPVALLKRGEARRTEYSGFAVSLVKALRSGDKKSLEALLNFADSGETSSALIIASKNNQLAQQCDKAADENFKSAKANLNSGMANWRILGGSLAKKVTKEIKAGFAEEFNAEMRDLGVQAQDVFKVD